MQQTTFPFEIIINDDASTDGTTEIIEEYQKKYPDKIFPVIQKENQYSKGLRSLAARNIFPIARGKYFAMCEGDDYWTDPLKLQKQVDFLERNENCSCCYHPVRWVYVNGLMAEKIEGPNFSGEFIFSPEEVISKLFVRMVSIVFRAEVFKEIPDWIFSSPNGDMPIQWICASRGNIGYIGGEPMAVYRRGVDGAWSQKEFGNKEEKFEWQKKWLQDNIKMIDLFAANSDGRFKAALQFRKREAITHRLYFLQTDNGNRKIIGLMIKHFDKLLWITDKVVIKFWLRFIFGKRFLIWGKAFVRKRLSRLKPRMAS